MDKGEKDKNTIQTHIESSYRLVNCHKSPHLRSALSRKDSFWDTQFIIDVQVGKFALL